MGTMRISERIRQARKSRGLTQAELAEQLNMSEMTIRRWEGGATSPRMEEIQKIAQALNVPVSELLNDTPEDPATDPQIQLIPTQSRASQETNTGMAILTLENGRKIEAPATPEGYAFLERIYAMTQPGAIPAV